VVPPEQLSDNIPPFWAAQIGRQRRSRPGMQPKP